MGLFKEVKRPVIRAAGGGAGMSTHRPVYVTKTAPCIHSCPSGTDVRGWLVALAQHQAYGRTAEQALESAWRTILQHNPFPAICGRVCQHPCELNCNRKAKDGAVEVNRLEQFVGDYALAHGWRAELPTARAPDAPKVAIVGAGPAGLAAAYHLALAGCAVSLFDAAPAPGGMMRYGIPRSVIPADVLDGEVANILGLGVEFHGGIAVGRDIPIDQMQRDFRAVFFAIGLQKPAQLAIQSDAKGEAAFFGEFPADPAPSFEEASEVTPRILNTVSVAIAQGQNVAHAILAFLDGKQPAQAPDAPPLRADKVKLDWYPAASRRAGTEALTEAEAIAAAARCMSCGMCMDCETCWMYCSKNCFVKLPKGQHYKITLDLCNGCGKCVDSCPCGYLEMH